jgi:hypothetical protein
MVAAIDAVPFLIAAAAIARIQLREEPPVPSGLHRPPEFIGVLASAQGVGAIAGGVLVARLTRAVGALAAISIGMAAFGLGDALYALPWRPASRSMASVGVRPARVSRSCRARRARPSARRLSGVVGMSVEQRRPDVGGVGVGPAVAVEPAERAAVAFVEDGEELVHRVRVRHVGVGGP